MDFEAVKSILLAAMPAAFIVIAAVIVLFKLFGRRFWQSSLADYKHELSVYTENQKLDYQKDFTNFNLYVSKKHEWYIQLYEAILLLQSSLIELAAPYQSYPDLQEYGQQDILAYLDKLPLTPAVKEKVIGLAEEDNCRDTGKLIACMRDSQIDETYQQINCFKNIFLKSSLYLSKELQTQLEGYSRYARRLYLFSSVPRQQLTEESYEKQAQLGRKLKESFEQITATMRAELSEVKTPPKA